MGRRNPMIAALVAVAALATSAGCTGDSDDAADDEPTSAGASSTAAEPTTDPPEESEPPSTEPTESSQTPEPSASADPEPSNSDTGRAKRAQIPAKQLPGFNDEWVWTKESSGSGPGQDVPSVCQRTSLTAIGAKSEYRTDYSSSLSDQPYAVQMTGVFPDEQTVATAKQVLESWQKSCRAHATNDLGLKRVDVGDLTTASTEAGDGVQWLTTFRPVAGAPDDSWFQAAGFVADGDTLTFLVITNAGQDYNYETGQQPMDLAVQQAGHYLISSR